MSEEKFIGFFRLADACRQAGCPVCRCVADDSRRYLDTLLYEHVTDPDTRRAIRASWGFCNWHTWMVLEIDRATFGAAIIYEDLVRRALARTQRIAERPGRRRRGWLAALRSAQSPGVVAAYRRRAVCPACVSAAESERRYLDTLVRFIDDGDLRAAYLESDGLCVPHLITTLESHGRRAGSRALVRLTRDRWATTGEALRAFVRKHDYRNREAYTDDEAASYIRALEVLAGKKGVFGTG